MSGASTGLRPGRRRFRARAGIAAAVVLVAVGVTLLVRQPWQPVTHLPAQACWGVLDADDLRPLAGGGNGTLTAATTTPTLQPGQSAGGAGYHCELAWHGGSAPTYLGNGPTIALHTESQLTQARALDASRGAVRPLSFGSGNTAWQAAEGYSLDLAIPCGFRDPYTGQSATGYARISIDAAGNPSFPPAPPPAEVRQADARIVLKLAKAFAQQYPCTGVTLPTDPPPVPAITGS
ncbi:hypothetical protein AB0F92_23285 [Kitasatospora aureofaciens]|uniref:hypothetical protein n=1 Tax=Kitasatospora aureofaciens TaxID=1894 RepID=UPI0033C2DF15